MMQTMIAYPKVTVLRAYGSFNASSATEFQQQLKTTVAADECTVILLDMEHVESIDSAGLMVLVQSLRLVEGWGKRFSLCSFSPALRIIFELTQLDSVFEIFENAEAFEAALAQSEVVTPSYYSEQSMCA